MSHSVIILPEDTNALIVDAISQAKRTLAIKIFVFKDASLLRQVILPVQPSVPPPARARNQ